MAQALNQFLQSVEKGMLDLSIGTRSVVSCQVSSTSAGLIPGQAVKLVDIKGGIPDVVEIAADTDDVFGFVAYNLKDQSFSAGMKVEVAFFRAAIMYMEASAAIVPYAKVMAVVTGQKVATATTGKTIIGRALDKAAASGELIRVMIDLPGSAA
jgi:hypothetical protein